MSVAGSVKESKPDVMLRAVSAGETVQSCPVCGSASMARVFTKSYTGANIAFSGIASVELIFKRCRSCGIVFAAPLPEEATRAAFAWYEELYQQAARAEPPHNPVNRTRYREWLHMLNAYRGAGRLFETGFGRGEFLLEAVQDGWTCSGNEVSSNACDSVSRFGVHAYCGDIASVDASGMHDLVVSLGVIEHVRDPHVQLRHYARLLRPGGAAFITTPNYNSLSRWLLGPRCRVFDVEHLFYFTQTTISRYLRDAGFDVVTRWTKNINVPEILNGFRRQQQARDDVDAVNQELRQAIEGAPALKVLKTVVNAVVKAAGVGEELYAIGVKRDSASAE